jgi:ABC-type transport system involved in cytochrome c biogenesis permease subunit
MAAAKSENRSGCGCWIAGLGILALACVVEVVIQDAATAHPGFFVNLPGWAEASAFVFGFLTVILSLIWIAVMLHFGERDRTVVWVTSLVIVPVLIACAGFAFQALPPSRESCNEEAAAQTCAYIHTHPFAVLALFVGGILGAVVFVSWLYYRSKRRSKRAEDLADSAADQSGRLK